MLDSHPTARLTDQVMALVPLSRNEVLASRTVSTCLASNDFDERLLFAGMIVSRPLIL